MAVAFGPRSRHIDKVADEGYIYELDPSNGLGGVRSYTHKHTFTHTYAYARTYTHSTMVKYLYRGKMEVYLLVFVTEKKGKTERFELGLEKY